MSERTLSVSSLYARHLPDAGPGPTHPHPDKVELGAGHVEIGVMVDGARVPLARLKAGGVFKKIAAAKAAAPKSKSKTD